VVLLSAACAGARGVSHSSGAPRDMVSAQSGDMAAAEPRGQTADQQVRHALNRLAFGARPGDVARVRAMGVDRWIAEQLAPARPDTAVRSLLAHYPTIALSADELTEAYPPPQQIRAQQRRDGDTVFSREDSAKYREAQRRAQRIGADLISSKVARAVVSERQLDEVMADFWTNHFSIFIGKGPPERYYLTGFDRDVIRPHAMGKFRDLLGAVAKSPAMLWYLDNWQSAADSGRPTLALMNSVRRGQRGGLLSDRPGRRGARRNADMMAPPPPQPQRRPRGLNENYGRELLELHTLGVDGGYTQQDVIEVARALTGWSIEDPRRGGEFIFRPGMHDAGPKKVLGVTLAGGRGIEDGEQVLDIVARHPSTAHYIALKLSRRFVSDTPPAALVDRAAATFTRTDGDIREVVRTILTSPEFFSHAAYRSKIKSPFELVVSALRAVNAAPDTTPRTALIVGRLGQPLYGHQAPNGYPETGDSWINTGSILNRINFGSAVASGRLPGISAERWPQFTQLQAAERATQVDAVIDALLGGESSPDTRAILISGENPLASSLAKRTPTDTAPEMAEVEDAAGDGMAGSQDNMRPPRGPGRRGGMRGDPLSREQANLTGLPQVIGLALGAPEFQRR
jgi:uncharacterized protein (DUF1800 family)